MLMYVYICHYSWSTSCAFSATYCDVRLCSVYTVQSHRFKVYGFYDSANFADFSLCEVFSPNWEKPILSEFVKF